MTPKANVLPFAVMIHTSMLCCMTVTCTSGIPSYILDCALEGQSTDVT
jgi:hypothetical protein